MEHFEKAALKEEEKDEGFSYDLNKDKGFDVGLEIYA